LTPLRGEVWFVDLDPSEGHEQAGTRPCLIVSADGFNSGPAGLVYAVPITSRRRGVFCHIEIQPPEGGLEVESFAMAEQMRAMSVGRLRVRFGSVSSDTLAKVATALWVLLGL
jgi:mRNA interferase MazF